MRGQDAAQPLPPLSRDLLAELLPVVGEINAVLDPQKLLPTIALQLKRIVDYRILEIFLPGPDDALVPAYVSGYAEGHASRMRIPPGQGIVGSAAKLREPVFVPDVTKDPRYVEVFPGVVAEMAIPLVHRDRLVGVLNVEGPDPSAFTPEARTALEILAGHVAVALENATLYGETRWYAGLRATLYRETASILDLDALLQRVAEVVRRFIDYEMFGILLLDPRRDELVLRKAVHFGRFKDRPRLKITEGLCGAAVRTRQPVLVGDVRTDPRYVELIPETRSELVVPFILKDRVVGVFDLESSLVDGFTEEHVKILNALAGQVAVTVENARLYEELLHKEERRLNELKIARKVQRGLFPEECPSGPRWDASAYFRPAYELGGDLYDFYNIGDGLLGLAVGDVAGKGVPAALYGAFASGTVRARAFQRNTPADLLYRVNRTLRRRGVDGLFCTLTFALFDFGAGQLRIANSGLPYPLHVPAMTGRCESLDIGGLPLGSFEEATYEERMIELTQGDIFVFYTDGITEAHNGKEAYGMARLKRVVEKHAGGPRMGERILEDLDAFMEVQALEDDVTLVVVRVK